MNTITYRHLRELIMNELRNAAARNLIIDDAYPVFENMFESALCRIASDDDLVVTMDGVTSDPDWRARLLQAVEWRH